MEDAEIECSDQGSRFHQAEWNRSHGGGVCITDLEMAEHVINRPVFGMVQKQVI